MQGNILSHRINEVLAKHGKDFQDIIDRVFSTSQTLTVGQLKSGKKSHSEQQVVSGIGTQSDLDGIWKLPLLSKQEATSIASALLIRGFPNAWLNICGYTQLNALYIAPYVAYADLPQGKGLSEYEADMGIALLRSADDLTMQDKIWETLYHLQDQNDYLHFPDLPWLYPQWTLSLAKKIEIDLGTWGYKPARGGNRLIAPSNRQDNEKIEDELERLLRIVDRMSILDNIPDDGRHLVSRNMFRVPTVKMRYYLQDLLRSCVWYADEQRRIDKQAPPPDDFPFMQLIGHDTTFVFQQHIVYYILYPLLDDTQYDVYPNDDYIFARNRSVDEAIKCINHIITIFSGIDGDINTTTFPTNAQELLDVSNMTSSDLAQKIDQMVKPDQ